MTEASVKIALINYDMGNLRSVANALRTAGAEVVVVNRPEEARDAAGLVLPGVGALGDCVDALKASRLGELARQWIAEDRPFLGVCLGLQALFESSEEGGVAGLGIFPGRVVRFRLPPPFKVPHMGWNSVEFRRSGQELAAGLSAADERFYFVHSYYVVPEDDSLVLAETEYGVRFASAVGRGRCFATQFHPEKSQAKGLQIYRNFVAVAAKSSAASAR